MKKVKSALIIASENKFLPTSYVYILYDNGDEYYCNYNDFMKLKNKHGNNNILVKQTSEQALRIENIKVNRAIFSHLRPMLEERRKVISNKLGRKYNINVDSIRSLYDSKKTPIDKENAFENYRNLCYLIFRECKALDIHFEQDPDVIIRSVVDYIKEDTSGDFLDGFHSLQEMYFDYSSRSSKCSSSREAFSLSTFYASAENLLGKYVFDYFSGLDDILEIANDKNYHGRKEILKSWAEFLVAFPDYFEMLQTLKEFSLEFQEKSKLLQEKNATSNPEFLTDLMLLMDHDTKMETYHYHATVSEEAAKNILANGLFVCSNNLVDFSFPEMSKDGVLNYSYGNVGVFDTASDYIIVLRQPVGKDIVRRTTDEEKANNKIMARRPGLNTPVNDYVIDSSNIVGYIDKEKGKVVWNNNFEKNDFNVQSEVII